MIKETQSYVKLEFRGALKKKKASRRLVLKNNIPRQILGETVIKPNIKHRSLQTIFSNPLVTVCGLSGRLTAFVMSPVWFGNTNQPLMKGYF